MGIRGSTYVITMTGANQELISPSEKRCYLMFLPVPGNAGTIAINNRVLLSSSDGFAVATGIAGVRIGDTEWGDLVKGPWFAFGSNSTDKIAVIEGVYI